MFFMFSRVYSKVFVNGFTRIFLKFLHAVLGCAENAIYIFYRLIHTQNKTWKKYWYLLINFLKTCIFFSSLAISKRDKKKYIYLMKYIYTFILNRCIRMKKYDLEPRDLYHDQFYIMYLVWSSRKAWLLNTTLVILFSLSLPC